MLFVIFFLFFVFFAEIFLQNWWIKVMHKEKIEQVTKLYGPAWHEKTKLGTPTMGGVVFAAVALLCVPVVMLWMWQSGAFLFIPREDSIFDWWKFWATLSNSAAILSYPILAGAVGFADEWLKYRRHSSDGFTSKQKLALQILVTLPWAAWMYFYVGYADIGVMRSFVVFAAVVTFIGVGLQNAVNVTDGLDGLAAGCSLVTFIALLPLTAFCAGMSTSAVLYNLMAIALCLGFLWHNCNPASVFMGDVGAHFLAGLMLSLCICSGAVFYIIPVCFFFGVEICSVAIQIVAIRKFHRKVFKMSPIHHHFEMSGWKETQIVTRFWIIHLIGVVILCMAYIVFAY